jgi:hypothetical protein
VYSPLIINEGYAKVILRNPECTNRSRRKIQCERGPSAKEAFHKKSGSASIHEKDCSDSAQPITFHLPRVPQSRRTVQTLCLRQTPVGIPARLSPPIVHHWGCLTKGFVSPGVCPRWSVRADPRKEGHSFRSWAKAHPYSARRRSWWQALHCSKSTHVLLTVRFGVSHYLNIFSSRFSRYGETSPVVDVVDGYNGM